MVDKTITKDEMTVKTIIKEEMIDKNTTMEVIKTHRYVRKELVKASKVFNMWKKLFAGQLSWLASSYTCKGCVVTDVDKSTFSMCLNETCRALSVKLKASSMLTSVDIISTCLSLIVLTARP